MAKKTSCAILPYVILYYFIMRIMHMAPRAIGTSMVLILCLLGAPALAAPAKIPPKVSLVEFSNPEIVPGQSFTATVYFVNASAIKKVDVLVNGKKIKTCGAKPSCTFTIKSKTENLGENEFNFDISGKNGTKAKEYGVFTVVSEKPGEPANGDSFILFRTNTLHPKVGQKIKFLAITKNKTVVDSIASELGNPDNRGFCGGGTYSCGSIEGPFTKNDIGERYFSFTVTKKDGGIITARGKTWVQP